MADIRRLGSEDQDLKSEFIDSMEECRILLADRFSRLENVNIIQPACDKEIVDVSNQFLKIDADHFNGDISGLKKTDYFASDLVKELYDNHVKSTPYCFQIMKNPDCKCSLCSNGVIKDCRTDADKLIWLPLPKRRIGDENVVQYKPYDEMRGSDPDPSDQPSLTSSRKRGRKSGSKNKIGKAEKNKESLCGDVNRWNASRVRSTVSCAMCDKIRCIFSQYKPSIDDQIELQR